MRISEASQHQSVPSVGGVIQLDCNTLEGFEMQMIGVCGFLSSFMHSTLEASHKNSPVAAFLPLADEFLVVWPSAQLSSLTSGQTIS